MGITKPSKTVFWIAFVLGFFAIVNQYFININIPIIGMIPNMILLSIAFILIMLSVVFRKF